MPLPWKKQTGVMTVPVGEERRMDDAINVTVFAVIVMLRIGVPLAIPRYPLPSVVAAMLIDAADQTVFQRLTTLNLDSYQSYDKALDIYYLSIAYISTMRNWVNLYGFQVSRFLWYYRLVGVTAFELSQWRPLLLIFPNTFEYFFIWYEAVCTRWNPLRLVSRTILGAAAFIWIFIKLPQEYWIHIAQLDTTDLIKEDILGVSADTSWSDAISQNLWVIPVVAAIAGILYVVVRRLWRRLPPADWELTFDADEHADTAMAEVGRAGAGRLRLDTIIEKTILIGLITIIFANILPGADADNIGILVTVAAIITGNAALSSWLAGRGMTWNSTLKQFGAMVVMNLGLALIWIALVTERDTENSISALVFFVLLLSLIVTLFDRYHPLYDWRAGPHRLHTTPGRQAVPATNS